jgi:hypothetical protein
MDLSKKRLLCVVLLSFLAFFLLGCEFLGNIRETRGLRSLSPDSFGPAEKDTGNLPLLFSKQFILVNPFIPGSKTQQGRTLRGIIFMVLVILLPAALSKALMYVCSVFGFYITIFFHYLVSALLIGGHAPPFSSLSF